MWTYCLISNCKFFGSESFFSFTELNHVQSWEQISRGEYKEQYKEHCLCYKHWKWFCCSTSCSDWALRSNRRREKTREHTWADGHFIDAYLFQRAFEASFIKWLTLEPYILYWFHITNVTSIQLMSWYFANWFAPHVIWTRICFFNCDVFCGQRLHYFIKRLREKSWLCTTQSLHLQGSSLKEQSINQLSNEMFCYILE